jgi:small subunit ribosomal protein S16
MQRLGRRHRPFYRINAIDQRTRRDGRIIENLGWYNPVAPREELQLELKADRIKHWLSQGAQPSDTVRDLLGNNDILEGKAKAQWEADRKVARERVEAKIAEKKAAEAAAAAAESSEGSSGGGE